MDLNRLVEVQQALIDSECPALLSMELALSGKLTVRCTDARMLVVELDSDGLMYVGIVDHPEFTEGFDLASEVAEHILEELEQTER